MSMMTILAALCAVGAVAALVAYVVGVRRIRGGRPLTTLSLFSTAMALWQISMALLYGLKAGAHMNIIFGAAFLLMAAICQVAGAFRTRERRADARAPQPLPQTT